jgi:hypothetical protein
MLLGVLIIYKYQKKWIILFCKSINLLKFKNQ